LKNAKTVSPSITVTDYMPPSLWPITMKNRYACKF